MAIETAAYDMNQIVGTHDIVFVTLDTLRFDVAQDAHVAGETPNLSARLGASGWERRHTPGSFTYAAHHAFFAGFLPTPASPGRHPRLFASRFLGSETTVQGTCVFEEPDIVTGLTGRGYHTACIGGVGFFNKHTKLGSVLPGFFAESHWSRALGVTDPDSTANQFALAAEISGRAGGLLLLFVNVSALHQPNRFYVEGASGDSIETHRAALRYVDAQWPRLERVMAKRGRPTFFIVCADHGTAYGEEGFSGHRIGHPTVYTVPYADFIVPCARDSEDV